VATILSAQCTDVRVNIVTPALFMQYPTPAALARIESPELEPVIRSTGFFRNKAKNIVGAARMVVQEFGGGTFRPANNSDRGAKPKRDAIFYGAQRPAPKTQQEHVLRLDPGG